MYLKEVSKSNFKRILEIYSKSLWKNKFDFLVMPKIWKFACNMWKRWENIDMGRVGQILEESAVKGNSLEPYDSKMDRG